MKQISFEERAWKCSLRIQIRIVLLLINEWCLFFCESLRWGQEALWCRNWVYCGRILFGKSGLERKSRRRFFNVEDLNVGFLSTALWKYNVEILSTVYNVEGLEVKVFRRKESWGEGSIVWRKRSMEALSFEGFWWLCGSVTQRFIECGGIWSEDSLCRLYAKERGALWSGGSSLWSKEISLY